VKPAAVNILGIQYKIDYVTTPSEVDVFKRESLWGQIDPWTRTIRVYCNDRSDEDIFATIMHEALHGICMALKLDDVNECEDTIGLLALGLADTLTRNEWVKL
jgi:hypothetical protein